MAKTTIQFLPLLLSLLYISTIAATTPTNSLKSSCSTTQYPAVCIQSLSGFSTNIQSDPRQLAEAALSVTLNKAMWLKTFVTKLTKFKGLKKREYEGIKDCLEEMSESIYRISKSVKELKNMTGNTKSEEFIWHMSNVETWVSAAITDENTCLDGFSGRALNGKIKDSIRAQVTKLAQVTSNALALVNNVAEKH